MIEQFELIKQSQNLGLLSLHPTSQRKKQRLFLPTVEVVGIPKPGKGSGGTPGQPLCMRGPLVRVKGSSRSSMKSAWRWRGEGLPSSPDIASPKFENQDSWGLGGGWRRDRLGTEETAQQASQIISLGFVHLCYRQDTPLP